MQRGRNATYRTLKKKGPTPGKPGQPGKPATRDKPTEVTLASATDAAVQGKLTSHMITNIAWKEQAIPPLLRDTLLCAQRHDLHLHTGAVGGQELLSTLRFINSLQDPCARALFYSPLVPEEQSERLIDWLSDNCDFDRTVEDYTQKWRRAFRLGT